MVVVDTNVVAELMRPTPDRAVVAWIAAQNVAALHIAAPTAAELFFGVAISPDGRRKTGLRKAIDDIVRLDFKGRVVPFDVAAADRYAAIAAARRANGRPISVFDGQIAAIAQVNGASVATRNIRDFDGCDVTLVDPWTA